MTHRRGITLVVIAAFALVVPACGNGGDEGGAGGGTIDVTEKDFSIAVSPDSTSSGDLTFEVTNEGPSTHEFVIFKTDLAPDQLPTNEDGEVDEEGEGVEHVDEIEDIEPNGDGTLEVTLDAGNYVFICNLPGHYAAGMHTAFTVN
jgi:uncharacterized cupredoxin-like copper-binding protein